MKRIFSITLALCLILALMPITSMAATTDIIVDDFSSYADNTALEAGWGRRTSAYMDVSPTDSDNKVVRLANGSNFQISDQAGSAHFPKIQNKTGKIIMAIDVYSASDLTGGSIMEIKTGSSTWSTPFIIASGSLTSLGAAKSYVDIFDSKWHNFLVAIDLDGTNKPTSVYIDGMQLSTGTLGDKTPSFTGIAFKNSTSGVDYYLDNYKFYQYTADASVTNTFKINDAAVTGTPTDIPVSDTNIELHFSDPYINGSTLTASSITITPAPLGSVTYSFADGVGKINFASLASGETYTVNVTDGVKTVFGQAVTPSAMSFTTVAGANIPPIVNITAPTANQKFVPGENVNISATATDMDGSVASVEFFDGVTSLGVDNSAPYEAVLSGITAGAHTIKAVATDDIGATGEVSVNITASANQIPVVAITFPEEGTTFEQGDDMTVSGTVSDPDADGIASVEIYKDDAYIGDAAVAGNSFSFSVTSLDLGTHVIKAIATDGRGGEGQAETTINVVAEILTGYKVITKTDFTGYTGGAPSGWTEKNEGGVPGVRTPVTIDAEHGTSMQLEGFVNTNNVGIEHILTNALTGNVVFEANVRLGQTTNNVPLFYIQQSLTVPKFENFTLQFGKDGNIKAGKGQTKDSSSASWDNLMTYEANKWYKIRVEMNLNTRKQTIYINGSVFEKPMANVDMASFKYINIYKWDQAGTLILDDLAILQGLPATAVTGKVFKNVLGDVIANPTVAPDNTKTIEISFAAAMKADTFIPANITLKDAAENDVAFAGIYENQKYMVTINAPLTEGGYKLSFSDNVVDMNDVGLSSKHKVVEFNVVTGTSLVSSVLKNGTDVVENLSGLTSVKVECEIQNNTATAVTDAVYIVISYKDDILHDAKTVRLDIPAYSSATKDLTVDLAGNNGTNYKVRAYAWEDFNNMSPIAAMPYMQ